MKSLGQTGSAMPRAKPGAYDTALELLTTFGADETRKRHMTELRDATVAHDKARDAAQAAERKAAERDKAAQAAEAAAVRERQALADESAAATAALGTREKAVDERERLATEAEQSQVARDADLKRREDHLSKAGVRGF